MTDDQFPPIEGNRTIGPDIAFVLALFFVIGMIL